MKDWSAEVRQAGYRVSKIAETFGVSVRRLERFFAWKFKQTPKKWAKSVQIEDALVLLANGAKNYEAAGQVGLTAEAFCRGVKQLYGVSPRELLRKEKQLGRRKDHKVHGVCETAATLTQQRQG